MATMVTQPQTTSLARTRVRSGAWWLIAIAALSALNSLVDVRNWRSVSLGLTWAIDSLAQAAGPGVKIATLALSLLIAGLLAVIGLSARKQSRTAFAWGLMLYSFDGFIFVSAHEMLAVAFHTVALYFIFRGHQACRQLELLEQVEQSQPAEAA